MFCRKYLLFIMCSFQTLIIQHCFLTILKLTNLTVYLFTGEIINFTTILGGFRITWIAKVMCPQTQAQRNL